MWLKLKQKMNKKLLRSDKEMNLLPKPNNL